MLIEYKVQFSHEVRPITFCGEFRSLEEFKRIIEQPGTSLFKGMTSYEIISCIQCLPNPSECVDIT